MIKEAIEKIVAMSAPNFHEIAGLEYSDKPLMVIQPPLPHAFPVSTLDGFVQAMEAGLELFLPPISMIHIESETRVCLVSRSSDVHGRRQLFLSAEPVKGLTVFPYFNNWGPQEEFNIGLQAHFQHTPDLDYLLDLISHVDVADKVRTADTGITQEVTLQRSIALKERADVRPIVSLAPWRTFRELSQPASQFVFRIKEGNKFGLFEGDGGRWKIDAIASIASWLSNRIGGSDVADLHELPIIS